MLLCLWTFCCCPSSRRLGLRHWRIFTCRLCEEETRGTCRPTDLELLVLTSKAPRPAFTPRLGGSRDDKPGSFVLWKGPLELVWGMWRERWPLPFVPLSQWLVPLSWRCWGPVVVVSRLLLPVHHCSAVSKFSNRVRGVNGGPVLSKRRKEAQPSQVPAFKVWTWCPIFTCYMIFLWENP